MLELKRRTMTSRIGGKIHGKAHGVITEFRGIVPLATGDKVTTKSGRRGTVTKVEEDQGTLMLAAQGNVPVIFDDKPEAIEWVGFHEIS